MEDSDDVIWGDLNSNKIHMSLLFKYPHHDILMLSRNIGLNGSHQGCFVKQNLILYMMLLQPLSRSNTDHVNRNVLVPKGLEYFSLL